MNGFDATTEAALARLGDEPLPGEASDADIVAGALAGLDAGLPPLVDEAPRRSGRSRIVVIAFVAGAIAAAVVALAIGLGGSAWLSARGEEDRSLAPAVVDQPQSEGEVVERMVDARPAARGRTAIDAPTEIVVEEPVEATAEEPAQVDRKRSTQRSPAPAPGELLRLARQELERGDTAAAMARYRELQRRHPTSPEARAALVSMGRLELRRGRAKEALAWFDRYLATSAGAVREEARYHRILALRQLGRSAQERASIEAFLADHPKSAYAKRLRERLDSL